MQQFVVDRLYVGDPHVLLLPNPAPRLIDDTAEVLEVTRRELRPHVTTSRHKVGASCKLHDQMELIAQQIA